VSGKYFAAEAVSQIEKETDERRILLRRTVSIERRRNVFCLLYIKMAERHAAQTPALRE